MKKTNKKLFQKHHLTLVLGIIIGLTLTAGGAYAAVTITASNVTYSNTTSGLSSTNV